MEDRRGSYNNDHDLLIEINTKLGRALDDIRELKDGTQTTLSNHNRRITKLEEWKWRETTAIAIILALLQVALNYFIK